VQVYCLPLYVTTHGLPPGKGGKKTNNFIIQIFIKSKARKMCIFGRDTSYNEDSASKIQPLAFNIFWSMIDRSENSLTRGFFAL